MPDDTPIPPAQVVNGHLVTKQEARVWLERTLAARVEVAMEARQWLLALIDAVIDARDTEQTMCAAWRKRAEEAEAMTPDPAPPLRKNCMSDDAPIPPARMSPELARHIALWRSNGGGWDIIQMALLIEMLIDALDDPVPVSPPETQKE
jgi:hypothetical protein